MALFPFISLSMRLPFSLSRTSPYATLHNLPAIWCKSGVVVGVVDFRPKCPVYRSDLQRNGLWLPFLGGFRVNLHRGADVLVTHDVLNDLQVGLIFAQPGAERVPEIMAGEGRQQLRFPLFLFGLFQFGFVVCHADALDGAVDRLRILRLAEAVQEYEV